MAKNSFHCNIAPFEGDPDLCNFFFKQIEDLQKLNKWSNPRTIAFFKTKLQGNALKFYVNSREATNATTLITLKNIFLGFFRPTNVQTARMNLINIKLQHDESYLNVSQRISNLVYLAHPEITDAIALNSIMFSTFINVLPNNIRIKLLELDINDFQTAVDKAQHFLDIHSMNMSVDSERANVTDLSAQINSLKEELQNVKNGSFSHSSRENSDFRHPRRFNDSRIGKFKRNGQYNFRNRDRSFEANRNFRNKHCSFCGMHNHIMRDCRQFLSVIDAKNGSQGNQSQNIHGFNQRSTQYSNFNSRGRNFRRLNPNARSFNPNAAGNSNSTNLN